MSTKLKNSLIIGILISSLALYFAFRNVPFAELMTYLGAFNYYWIVPSIGVALFAFVLRVIRWQIILASNKKVGFWHAFHPVMISFMINSILPGRVGEFARPAILKKRDQIPFATGLATVVAERVFDMGLLILFFMLVLNSVNIDPDFDMAYGGYHLSRKTLETIGIGMARLGILLIAGILLIGIGPTRKIIHRIIAQTPSLFFFSGDLFRQKIRTRIVEPLIRITENIASGFALLKSPQKVLLCLGLSFFIWSLSALSFYIMMFGSPGIKLSFLEMAAVLVITCFFIALPSVPGFWGIWEAGGVFALSLFGVAAKDAVGYSLVNHVFQMAPVIIIGLISAVLTGINISQVSFDKREPD